MIQQNQTDLVEVDQGGEERSQARQEACLVRLKKLKRSYGTPSHSYKSTYSPAHVNHQQLVLCLQDLLGFAENCSNLTVYFRVGWISTVVFTEKKSSGICTRRKGNHDIIDASLSLASRNNHVYSDACWMLPLIPRQAVFSFLSIKRY